MKTSVRCKAAGLLLTLLCSLAAWGQTTYTLAGTDYELVAWPAAAVGTGSIVSTPMSVDYGGGSFSVAASEGLHSEPATTGNYYNTVLHSGAGYAIAPTPLFRTNNGQSEPAGNDVTVSYSITATRLPTELIFYVGGDPDGGVNSGLKYVRWAWASTQPGTQFEVLANSPSFTIANNSSPNLSWSTFGSLNNSAMALVRITNPAGISHFSITSNRLTAAGADTVYGSTNQRADYNGIAILAAKLPPLPVVPPVAVPALGAVAFIVLALVLGFVMAVKRRCMART